MSACRKSQDADPFSVKAPLFGSGTNGADGAGRVVERSGMVITWTEPVFQNEGRYTDRVQPVSDRFAFPVREMFVATAGTNDDCGAGRFLFHWQVRRQRGNVRGLLSDSSRRAVGPKNDWLQCVSP